MKVRVSRPKVLFLQGPRLDDHHRRSLELAVGKEGVCSIDAKNSTISGGVWVGMVIGWVLTGVAVVLAFNFMRLFAGFLVLIAGLCAALMTYLLGSRLKLFLLLQDAKRKAKEAWKTFRPTMVVASGYGAVTAFEMDNRGAGVPLLLLTPAQDRYLEEVFCSLLPPFNLRRFPYTVICHGASDSDVPLEDSLRLSRTVPARRSLLISLDSEDPSLKEVLADKEMRELLLYAYHEGWIAAFGSLYRERELFLGARATEPDQGENAPLISSAQESSLQRSSGRSFRAEAFKNEPPPFDFSILDLRDVVAFGTLTLARLYQETSRRKSLLVESKGGESGVGKDKRSSESHAPSSNASPRPSSPGQDEEEEGGGSKLSEPLVNPKLLEDAPEPQVETSDDVPSITWRLSEPNIAPASSNRQTESGSSSLDSAMEYV